MFQTANQTCKAAVLIILLLLVVQTLLYGQAADRFLAKTHTSGGNTLLYRILYPDNFNPELKYPLILFLHGAGERGSDNTKQLVHGGDFFAADTNRLRFPAVIVFPQCPADYYWANVQFEFEPDGKRNFIFDPAGKPTVPMQLTISLLDSLLSQKWLDKSRVYVGGLSMGGMGTFELLYRMPQVFAAAFPVCGGNNPNMINKEVSKVQVWAFHGTDDTVVRAELSEKMIDAYMKAGSVAWLTLFPGVGHNAWDYVFKDPNLLPWMFSVHR